MGRRSRYSPEFKERSVRMVLTQAEELGSRWAAIESVAAKIGCASETPRRWVRLSEREFGGGKRTELSADERTRLKELERENRELRRANEILRKASAFFAQAELDREPK